MKRTPSLALLMALFVVSCGEPKVEQSASGCTDDAVAKPQEKAAEKVEEKAEGQPNEAGSLKVRREPDHITVDHILIGVKHPGLTGVTRSIAEAKALADEIVQKLEDGADWAALKKQYSDDRGDGSGGGPYGMANTGVRPASGETKRSGMVPAFGNVGFTLEVGELGVAPHDPQASPYGFHIIKRIR